MGQHHRKGSTIRAQWLKAMSMTTDERRRHRERTLREALEAAGITGADLLGKTTFGMIDRGGCPICLVNVDPSDQIAHIRREHCD